MINIVPQTTVAMVVRIKRLMWLYFSRWQDSSACHVANCRHDSQIARQKGETVSTG